MPAHRGFTLIELMLVMVVLGVILSLATVVLPDRNAARLANEVARLVKVLDTLQLEAMLQRTQTGLVLMPDGYRSSILQVQSLEWGDSDSKLLAPHTLQENNLQLALLESGDASEIDQGPAIVFDASGVTDPFQLRLIHASGISTTLVSDGVQKVTLQ